MNKNSNDYDDRDIDSYRNLSVFKQAEVISKIIETIVDGIAMEDTNVQTEYDKAMYTYHTHSMMEQALLIPIKIAEAHQSDLYDTQMECATLIRKASLDILKDANGLQRAGFNELEYLDLLRSSIETLRPIFANWANTFNPHNYIHDRWGLFNPPGVHYQDEENTTGNIKSDLEKYLNEGDERWDDTNEDEENYLS